MCTDADALDSYVCQVDGQLWVVRICLHSVRQIRTMRCDGTEDISDQTQCPNIVRRYKPDVITRSIGLGSGEEHVAMTGSTAVNFLRAMLPRLAFPGSYRSLQQLLEQPPIVAYEHCQSCLAGNGSAAYIIQGAGGIFQSNYYKHCNGQYINAVGTRLNSTFRSADDKDGHVRSEAWTPRQIDSRGENKVWQLSGEMSSGAQEPASHEDRKQDTLMLMEERVRREEWTCEDLIAQAWGMNGGEQGDVRESMRGWWRKMEAGVQALRIGETMRVEAWKGE